MRSIAFRRPFTKAAFVLVFAAQCLLTAQSLPAWAGGNTDSIITKKIFPFYSYIAQDKVFAGIIQKDSVFRKQSLRQLTRIQTALKQCGNVDCYATAVQWSPEDIAAIGKRLAQLCRDNRKMRRLPPVLRAADDYNLYDSQSDTALIDSVWNDAAVGVNRILDIYIKGKKPRYPAIDSISFVVEDAAFREEVRRILAELLKQHSSKDLFFRLPLQFALKALAMNGRDEAARYEPLNEGINRTAVESIPGIQWSSFPYSLILVPGQGPDQEGVAIHPGGIERCRLAAERYRKGLAPLIVVSGGHVHPNKTPYSEAVEMKKYMVRELQIPENAILIDPHARHTTTNLRNTARMIYRFNIPGDKKILVVSDSIQSSYIPKMEKRFLDELGYLPYRGMKVLSAEENEFYPVREALQVNPLEPLDP